MEAGLSNLISQFLLRQAIADDEASTRLLQVLLSLLLSTASLMFIPYAIRSSFTLSIHFFGCLPLLLVPSTCPHSATTGSLFPSILVTCPNHVSLLFSDFVYQCDLLSQLLSGNLVSYPVSSGPSQYSSQPAHLRYQYPPFIFFSQAPVLGPVHHHRDDKCSV